MIHGDEDESWAMTLGSVMVIFQNSKSGLCLISLTLEPISAQVHDYHLVWTWSIDTWLLNWKFHNLEFFFETQVFCRILKQSYSWGMRRDRHVQPIWMNLGFFLILIFNPPNSTLEILIIVSNIFFGAL